MKEKKPEMIKIELTFFRCSDGQPEESGSYVVVNEDAEGGMDYDYFSYSKKHDTWNCSDWTEPRLVRKNGLNDWVTHWAHSLGALIGRTQSQ